MNYFFPTLQIIKTGLCFISHKKWLVLKGQTNQMASFKLQAFKVKRNKKHNEKHTLISSYLNRKLSAGLIQ